MKSEKVDLAEVVQALGALRQEVARLGERVAALEDRGSRIEDRGSKEKVLVDPRSSILDPRSSSLEAEGLSEELLLVISAAIAAYLGKKAHIRQIRLVGTTAWAQQGRVTIQASHALSARHARSQP